MSTLCLIPYRNRAEHLQHFLQHVVPRLQSELPDICVLVVEQSDEKPFNRGKLLNAGFAELGANFEWILMHDVDLDPSADTIKELYTRTDADVIRIYCGHSCSLGGICKIRQQKFREINGFPNTIWGWGVEDRALFCRAQIKRLSMTQNYFKKRDIKSLPQKSAKRAMYDEKKEEHDQMWRPKSLENKSQEELRMLVSSDGLNTLKYDVESRKTVGSCIEIIAVSLC